MTALVGYSVPETITDDAGNVLKSLTVQVTGPAAYTGTAVTGVGDGVLRLGPLPVGDYTVTNPLSGRSVVIPVVAAAADVQSAFDKAAAAIPLAQKGAVNGVASLDGAGTIPDAQIPATIARDAEVTSAVSAAVAALVASAPGALDTLAEIDAQLAADESAAAALTTAVAGKDPLQRVVTPAVTAAGALAVNKLTPVDATAGAVAMTLPTGQAEGTQIAVAKVDNTTNAVTITGNIRGAAGQSLSLALYREGILFRADSAGSWWPIADHKTLSSLDARFLTPSAAAGTYAPVRRIGARWVPLGDSITIGSDTTALPTRGASYTTFAGVASGERLHMIRNAGITGDTSAMMLARFDTDVTPYNPDVVTVLAGRNDVNNGVALATFQANIAAIVAKIRALAATPVLCLMTPGTGAYRQTTNDWNNWLRGYAARNGILLVDLYTPVVDPLTGTFLAAYDSGDHVHPSAAGYYVLGNALAAALSPYLSPLSIPRLTDLADTGNLFGGNPLFLNATLSSQAPAGLSLVNSGSVTGSFVTGDTTIQGNWYRMTFAASASDVTLYKSSFVTGATVGHVYAMTGLIKTAVSATGGINVQIGKGSGTAYALASIGASALNGRFWVPFTAAGTTLNPQIFIKSGTTGTVDVAEWALYDLTALGIDTLAA